MAVHYTKYDVVNIDGETVEVDENGNSISGDNGGNGGNDGGNSGGNVVESSYGTLRNTGLTLDNIQHTINLNMTGCNAGDILTVNYRHNHNQDNVGSIGLVSPDWSVIYYGGSSVYADVDNSSSSISVTLTAEQARKLTQDKSIKIQGKMLILDSIVLERP